MPINKLKQLLSGKFIRNVSWLGGAEIVNRIFRLGTTVTLARMFTPQDYGLLAVIYTTVDFANVFSLRGGIGSKIIQADEQELATICDTSYWLNWILCVAIFLLQCLAAFPLAWFYGNNQIILPLCTVSLMYLLLPFFMVHAALIERENRLKITALCNTTQAFFSNIITVALALLGMGVWSVVWAMVLTTPVWIVISCRNHSWRAPKVLKLDQWQEITRFCSHLLGVELLGMIRWNLDYLIVGRLLGLKELGIYYFAFNAGLGISLSVLSTFISALFPYLCEARNDFKKLKYRFFNSLKKTSLVLIPIVILQAALAPLYVPIVFSHKWVVAIPCLILLCLSAIPFPLSRSTYILLNTVDKTHINLYLQLVYTVVFAIAVLIGVQWGIIGVAAAVLISNLLSLVIGSTWSIRYVFSKPLPFSGSNANS